MTVSENNSSPDLPTVVVREWMEKQRLMNKVFKQKLDEILRRLDTIEQQLAEGERNK